MSEQQKLDPSTGQFIDPMFAVVIAAAMAETVVQWVKSGPTPDVFEICVVTVGYVNLLLSWFGYHKSVLKKPIMGSLRFIITVVLLPLYLLSIILFSGNFLAISIIYSMIFFLWTIWEYFKSLEYRQGKSFWGLQFRPFNLIIYSSTLAQVAHATFPALVSVYVPKNWLDWTSLSAVAFSILFLRVSKSSQSADTPAGRIRSELRSLFFGSDQTEAQSQKTEEEPPASL